MSTSLYWEPQIREKSSLSDRLKKIFMKEYDLIDEFVLTKESIHYLRGLRDGGISEVDILIKAIKKYQYIVLTIES